VSAPATAARRRQFDILTTVLIGVVALLAAVLAILQSDYGTASSRAADQAARLEGDVSAKIQASSLARDAGLRAAQDALAVGMSGIGLGMAGLEAGDPTAQSLGSAQTDGGKRLQAAIDESVATSGQSPVDPYTSGLINAQEDVIAAEVTQQNAAVDEASDTGSRSNRAVLGLSLATLGGVLAGIAAVVRVGRPGWLTLGVAWVLVAAAALVAEIGRAHV
jgi:hypothetical protein